MQEKTTPQDAQRLHYLKTLLKRYGTIILPINSQQQHISLQTVFQPLKLQQAPFTFERAEHETDEEESVAQSGPEALTKSPSRRMVVLGGPGMGKTTVLKDLLRSAIEQAMRAADAPLPLFISLPDLARSGLSLADYLLDSARNMGTGPTFAASLATALDNGNIFACLDSLDEVIPAQRPAMIALINQAAMQYGGTWIIGSRFTEYKGGQFASGQFFEWELQALDLEAQRRLIQQLIEVLAVALHKDPVPSAKVLHDTLCESSVLSSWSQTPLLLSLATIVYVQQEMLPASRAELYRSIVATMLAQRIPQEQQAELRSLLAQLSLQLYQTQGRNFSLQALQDVLSTQKPAGIYAELPAIMAMILDSGLLDVVAHETYGFKHQAFQEYLAAVALARQLCSPDENVRASAWEFALRKRTYSRWQEILKLLVGVLVQEYGTDGNAVAVRWLQRLLDESKQPDGDVGDLCFTLAVKSLREFPQFSLSPEMREMIATVALTWAEKQILLLERLDVSDRYNWHRKGPAASHAEDIAMLDLQLVLPAVKALEDELEQGIHDIETKNLQLELSWLTTNLPVDLLQRIYQGVEGVSLAESLLPHTVQKYVALEPLIDLLRDKTAPWNRRCAAVSLLGKWGEQAPLDVFYYELQDTTNHYQIRVAIFEELMKLDLRFHNLDVLLRIYPDKQHQEVNDAITKLLSQGDEHTIEVLLGVADDGSDYRCSLRDAVDEIFARLLPDPTIERKDSESDVSVEFQYNLIKRFPGDIPVLVLLNLCLYKDASVRGAAEKALVLQYGQSSYIQVLLNLLFDEYAIVSSKADDVLVDRREQVPLEVFYTWLHDADTNKHDKALLMLDRLDAPVPVDIIQKLLRDDPLNFHAWSRARKLKLSLPFAPLLEIVADTDPSYLAALTFNKALYILQCLETDAPIAALLEMVRTAELPVRERVSEVLEGLAPYVPLDDVEAMLASGITDAHLIMILYKQGRKITVEQLLYLLQSKVGNFRDHERCVRSLVALGENAPIAALLDLAPDDDEMQYHKVGRQAIEALRQLYFWITPQQLVNTLGRRDNDVQVALSALALLKEQASRETLRLAMDDAHLSDSLRTQARRILQRSGEALPLELLEREEAQGWQKYDEEMVAVAHRLGADAPFELLFSWLKSDRMLLYATAIEALRQLASYVPLEPLKLALKSENRRERQNAARVCGAMGERAPIETLCAVFREERCEDAEQAMFTSFLELRPYTPQQVFVDVITNNRYHRLCIRRLGEWIHEVPLELVLRLMENKDYGPRDSVIQALSLCGEKAPLDLFIEEIERNDTITVSSAAIALGRLGQKAVLMEHLYDKWGAIREEILEGLFALGAAAPVELLLSLLNSADLKFREVVEMRLDELAEAAPERFLALTHEDTRLSVRQARLKAVAKLGDEAPLDILFAALEDESTRLDVYYIAQEELDLPAEKLPVELLLRSLEDEGAFSVPAIALLKKLGSQVPVALLGRLLGNSESYIVEAAADTFCSLYPDLFKEQVVPYAEAILRGEPLQGFFFPRLQSRVARVVKHIGRTNADVLKYLSDLLDAAHWQVRKDVAEALGAIHRRIPDRAIRRLLELRHDPHAQAVREAAEKALGEILSYEEGIEDE